MDQLINKHQLSGKEVLVFCFGFLQSPQIYFSFTTQKQAADRRQEAS